MSEIANVGTDLKSMVVAAQESPEVVAMRRQGAAAVAVTRERNQVMRALAGGKWGNIQGSSLSDQSRWMMARMAEIYEADPLLEIDILGGSFYLKSDYFARRLNALPNLTGLQVLNISAAYSQQMRAQARQTLKDAEEFSDTQMRERAQHLMREAQRADERRAYFQVPDIAVAAYEVIAHLSDQTFPRSECNYAPNGTNDPVGKARPAETARTRALGRLARKVIPSLRTAESLALKEGIEAEARLISDDEVRARALHPDSTGQAVRATGEPTGVNTRGASDLPTYGTEVRPDVETPAAEAPAPATPAATEAASFDRDRWRKRHMATLTDAAIGTDKAARTAWYTENGLPLSTGSWGEAEYTRADDLLCAAERRKFERGCELLGRDADELAHHVLGALPDGLRDLKRLNAELDRLAHADGGELAL